MKKILIISFTFPPTPGIGGRRWVKFAKYLQKLGHQINILASENIFNTKSEWIKDSNDLAIEYLPYHYPKVLSRPVKSIVVKIAYRLALAKVKLLSEGNFYDKSIFWQKQIEEKIEWYIQTKKCDTIIVTGAPFRLVYYTTKLKHKYPTIKFIADFRDLWTADTELNSFSGLSKKRLDYEQKIEKETIHNSDLVFTVANNMATYFSSLTTKNNCVVIPNGFDPEDFEKTKSITESPNDKINFIFAGTVYQNLDYILNPFFSSLKRIKQNNSELFDLVNIEFYGKFPNNYRSLISEHNLDQVVKVHGEKPFDEVATKINEAHYCLLFLNDTYNFSFSTKFCEYIGQQKKVVVVSSPGITSQYVMDNNLGHYINIENPYEALLELLTACKANHLKIENNTHFDSSIFSIEHIVKEINKYL